MTGARPTSNVTYSDFGVYGRLMANVNLLPGRCIIEFEPIDESGVFAWGTGMVGVIFRVVICKLRREVCAL